MALDEFGAGKPKPKKKSAKEKRRLQRERREERLRQRDESRRDELTTRPSRDEESIRRRRRAVQSPHSLTSSTTRLSTASERQQAMADALAYQLEDALRSDLEQSARSAPGAAISGERFLSTVLGPNITAALPIKGGRSASEASAGGLALDAALLGAPWFRGGRALARGVQAGAKGDEVAPAVKEGFRRRGVFKPRTLRIGEKDQQLHGQARSRITKYAIEKPADAISRALDKSERIRKIPGLRNATATFRAAKAMGREEGWEAGRSSSALGEHLRALKVSRRSRKAGLEEAHWWWAQLPRAYRSGKGLELIRRALRGELEELRSGRVLEQLVKRERSLKSELKAVDRPHYEVLAELEDLKILKADLPQRVQDIAASVVRLDRLVSKPPHLDESKIDALRALSEDRKRVLIEAEALNPERAANREGLVSRWLGLVPTGEEIYLGHRMGTVQRARESLLPTAVGTGKVRKPEGVASENKLVLAKTGRVQPTFDSAVGDWQASHVYRNNLRIRDNLGKIGDPLKGTRVDANKFDLINPRGRPVPRIWKMPEELEGGGFDEDEIRREAQKYIDEFFASDQTKIDEMLRVAKETGLWPELRVVRKDVTKRYFSQFIPAPKGGKAISVYDRFVDATAASIIFGRIGYIPKNMVQGIIMAVPHQGVFLLPNAVRAAQVLKNPKLRHLIKGEVGFSGATRAIGKEAVTKKGIDKLVGFVGSVADDPARISAFLHEAAAEKVISRTSLLLTKADEANLIRLLTAKSERPLLNAIRSRGVDAMGDFGRMTPEQRKMYRRLLIIPGWLMAGTRYPFHFAATHPVRSALMAYIAMGEPGAPERYQPNDPITTYFAKGLPSWAEGIETPWGVERTTSLSPVNTPVDIGLAAAQQGPETVGDYANPLLASAWHLANREATGPQGSYKTDFKTSLQRNVERLAPNIDLVRDMISPSESKYYPEDTSRLGRLKREVGVLPIEMTREAGAKNELQNRLKEERGVARQMGTPLPLEVENAITWRDKMSQARDRERERVGGEGKLSHYQAALIDLQTLDRLRPDLRDEIGQARDAVKKYKGKPKNLESIRGKLLYNLAGGYALSIWGRDKGDFLRQLEEQAVGSQAD